MTPAEAAVPGGLVSAVSFHEDRMGNISGRFKGAVVLRDRASEGIIRPGETWFCSLRLNPVGLGNYFARAMRKVDASFFMELEEDRKREIAEILWKSSRREIIPLIMEAHAVSRELHEKVSGEYERRIAELTERLGDVTPQSISEDPVIADTPEGLFSPEFKDGRYAVRTSANGGSLLIVPDGRGETECRGGVLVNRNLRHMIPFRGRRSVPCTRYGGGVLISLRDAAGGADE